MKFLSTPEESLSVMSPDQMADRVRELERFCDGLTPTIELVGRLHDGNEAFRSVYGVDLFALAAAAGSPAPLPTTMTAADLAALTRADLERHAAAWQDGWREAVRVRDLVMGMARQAVAGARERAASIWRAIRSPGPN